MKKKKKKSKKKKLKVRKFGFKKRPKKTRIKKKRKRINRRKTENINPLKNIFNDVDLFLKSNPIDTHKLLVFHLIRPQLGRILKNNMNVIIVPIMLK